MRCKCGQTLFIAGRREGLQVTCPRCGKTSQLRRRSRSSKSGDLTPEATEVPRPTSSQSPVPESDRLHESTIRTVNWLAVSTAAIFFIGFVFVSTLLWSKPEESQKVPVVKVQPVAAEPAPEPAKQVIPEDTLALDVQNIASLDDEGPERVADQLLVQLQPDLVPETIFDVLGDCSIEATVVGYLPALHEHQIQLDRKTLKSALESLRRHAAVVNACYNAILVPTRTVSDPVLTDSDPNNDWGLRAVRAAEAWNSATGKGVKIAVIDTGCLTDHPDLSGKICHSYSLLTRTATMFQPDAPPIVEESGDYGCTHGTHVAITAAGAANGVGTVGIAPDAEVIAIQYLPPAHSAFGRAVAQTFDLHDAMAIAVEQGADVVNLSIGWAIPEVDCDALKRGDPVTIDVYNRQSRAWYYAEVPALQLAHDHNVIVVKAAGNNDIPARFTGIPLDRNVVVVGAVDQASRRTNFSNYDHTVTVAAPGSSIYSGSADPNMPYIELSGTSMAAPHVSGVVALMREVDPDLTASEVIDLLQESGSPVVKSPGKPVGSLVDAATALDLLRLRRTQMENIEGPQLVGHSRQVDAAAISGNGDRAISWMRGLHARNPGRKDKDAEVFYWDLKTAKTIWEGTFSPPSTGGVPGSHGDMHFVTAAISNDGMRIAATQKYGTQQDVALWSFRGKSRTPNETTVKSGLISLQNLHFSPDGKYLFVNGHYPPRRYAAPAGVGYTLRVFDVETGKLVGESPFVQSPSSIHMLSDSSLLALGANAAWFSKATVSVHGSDWFQTNKTKATLDAGSSIETVRFSPNGKHLAAAADDLLLWETSNLDNGGRRVLDASGVYWNDVAFTADNQFLVAVSHDLESKSCHAEVFRVSTGRRLCRVPLLPSECYFATVSRDGSTVVSAHRPLKHMKVWRLDDLISSTSN